METDPKEESQLITDIAGYIDDPVGFVHYAYPWGQPGTPFADFKGPRPWQLEELEAIGEHVRRSAFAIENDLPAPIWRSTYSSGRGPGKSALFGMAAHWHMSTRIGAPTIVSANTETQLRTKTFPEFGVWFGAALNSHWFVLENLRIVPAPWLVDLVKVRTSEGGLGIDPKYWYVAGQMWSADNPDAFAGAHNPYGMMLLFDEASGIPAPIWNVAEGFFTEVNPYRFWLAASQMRANSGRFYDLFHDGQMGAGWRTRMLSTRGMPGVDQAVVEDQIKRYGFDSDFVRVEILGQPPQTAETQFIAAERVHLAEQNDLPRMNDAEAPLVLGVDPAPRGRTAWRFRQGRNARDCVGGKTHGVWEGLDNVAIAKEIMALQDRFQPDETCIDFGMGTGVIDELLRNRRKRGLLEVKFGLPAEEKKGEFGSRGAELWGMIRDWLPGAMVERGDGARLSLFKQLTDRGWKWSGREDNKKILESKDDLKKRGVPSPDDADALACTFAGRARRRDPGLESLAQGRGGDGRRGVTIAAGVEENPYGW